MSEELFNPERPRKLHRAPKNGFHECLTERVFVVICITMYNIPQKEKYSAQFEAMRLRQQIVVLVAAALLAAACTAAQEVPVR